MIGTMQRNYETIAEKHKRLRRREQIIKEGLERLYANNGSMIRNFCNQSAEGYMRSIGKQFFIKDYGTLYSAANVAVAKAITTYDPDKNDNFIGYIRRVVRNAVDTELIEQGRYKRKTDITTMSINDLINVDGKNSIERWETIEDEVNTDPLKILTNNEYSEKVQEYLCRLSSRQKKILALVSEGYTYDDMMRILNITHKQLTEGLEAIRSVNNTMVIMYLCT